VIGKTLAHYEVTAHLGAGGMGEVVRARDTKLGRDVALKILPAAVADDAERLARFQREAQLLASLNHPNIAAIHGVEEDDDVRFLVMELAEGEDLQVRLRDGALPLEDATAIARDIAEGLEEAHECGVVHRDLKPANVMVSTNGKVKILDFGLARAYSGSDHEEGDPALSPTITAAMTSAGTVLGSAAYMSPEQAKGREVDRRTDIWAFGVILYEMITGQRLFEGETVSETMAAVLKDPIDLDTLPAEVPVGIRSLLARCLERDPRRRLRDIGEARIHLDPSATTTVLSGGAPAAKEPVAMGGRAPVVPWTLFVLAVLAAAWFALDPLATTPEDGAEGAGVIRAAIEPPDGVGLHLSGANPGPATISPDGTRLVYTARTENGGRGLWLQELSHRDARRLEGTDDGQYPFWSPDGRSIAYFSDADLRVHDLDSRTDRAVAAAGGGKGGCWFPDDTILFAASAATALSRLDLATGEVSAVTRLSDEPAANSHRHPRSLGSDRYFLFAGRTTERVTGPSVAILFGDLETGEVRELLRADGQAEFAAGHLFYALESKLYARPFDAARGEFTGVATLVADGVGLIPGAGLSLVSVAPTGALAYHPGERVSLLGDLLWFDLEGEALGPMGAPAGYGAFDISPDGRRVAYAAFDNQLGTGDLYVHDVETDVRTRLTFDAAGEEFPVWSPDGRTVYYLSTEGGVAEIRGLEPDGRGDPVVIYADSNLTRLDDVSPDGTRIAFGADESEGTGEEQAYVMDLDGEAPPIRIDPTSVSSGVPRFSPDGLWIAYAARDGGGWRLNLKANPPGSRKWQVSDTDAFWFDWHPQGDRLFHQWGSGDLSVTAVDLSGTSPAVGATRVQVRDLQTPISGLHGFRIAPDGERILITSGESMEDDRPIRLVIGWDRIVGDAMR